MQEKLLLSLAALLAVPVFAASAPAQSDDSQTIGEANDAPFVYDIPDRVMAVAALAEQLEADRESARIGLQERQAENDRYTSDRAMPPLAYHQSWMIAGEYGRLLSLSSAIYSYDGGAHGNTAYDARLWDIDAGRGLAFSDLFTDRYAAYSLIDKSYCAALAAEQAEREIDTAGDGLWDGCPLVHEQTLVPKGEPGGPLEVITVMVPPYMAGPYSAGSFEINVAVTPAIRALLRPEYRSAFAAQQ